MYTQRDSNPQSQQARGRISDALARAAMGSISIQNSFSLFSSVLYCDTFRPLYVAMFRQVVKIYDCNTGAFNATYFE